MPPSTLRDLIDSNERLANSTLAQTQAINKLAAAHERLIPSFEQLRRDLADIKMDRELDSDKLQLAINKINTDLALLARGVDDTKQDMKDLAKDVTGTHLLPQDNRSTAERLIDKFERMQTATKLWIFALVLVVVGGFGLHLILAAFGLGG